MVMVMSVFHLNIRQFIYSLSNALDLVGVTNVFHGRRVAYMSNLCAVELGWDNATLDQLFEASILHDCGVSQTNVHAKLTQLQWEEESNHCAIGAELLKRSPHLHHLSDIILYHHTHWDDLKSLDIPEHVKLCANCIYMADRIDVLTLTSKLGQSNVLLGVEETLATVNRFKGSWFAPELVEAFNRVAAHESFWLDLENVEDNVVATAWIENERTRAFSFADLKELVQVFSRIVDAKSPFTHDHSQGVARLSRYLAELFELSETQCDRVEIAGLLHDIGKLRTPDEYLEKPGKLTESEYAMLRRHSYDTFNILKKIGGFEEIALWASQHHERIDGTGYPAHLSAENISLEARIISVADVFQALAQKRPYRDPLQPEEIMTILNRMVQDGALEGSVVARIQQNLNECYKKSLLLN